MRFRSIISAFPYAAKRAIAYGDGWIPHATRPEYGGGDITAKLPEFREMAKAAGRDPTSIPVTAFNVSQDLDTLKRYEAAGVDRVVFSLPSADREATLPLLDEIAAAITRMK